MAFKVSSTSNSRSLPERIQKGILEVGSSHTSAVGRAAATAFEEKGFSVPFSSLASTVRAKATASLYTICKHWLGD
jgi:hypothetical protein